MTSLPPDSRDRQRIAEELSTTLFVEAGAGSGKTTALVDRVVALVVSGHAPLRSIAAVTFTEKAGAELRDHLRRRLEQRAATEPDPIVHQRCTEAIDQLDGAAIGTLHSFAQRILSENPVEAGLPPRIEVLDEVGSDIGFERRWVAFQDELLADAHLERTLLLLFASGVRPEALRVLAREFDRNWDLVEERVGATAPEPPHVRELLELGLAGLDAVCQRRSECSDRADRLSLRLDEVAAYTAWLRGIDDELDLLDELRGEGHTKAPGFKAGNLGQTCNWNDVGSVRRALAAAGEDLLPKVLGAVSQACARRVAAEVRRFTLNAAAERRNAGQLAFHDLLVLSRSLMRDPDQGPAVRRRLHARYRHLLLDEFQDTDPIQIELAVRIAAADPESDAAGRASWSEVPVTPGQLFVVGDPKQSIYRFRRADIATFLRARDRFGPDGGGVVELSANFRSARPIIDWVNTTFGQLMGDRPAVEPPVPSQPRYVALQPTRAAPPVGPPVAVIARQELADGLASDLRTAEARSVAVTVARAMTEGWSVRAGNDGASWRPARLGDITVLVPARTSLPFLEAALDDAGIPYRAESSSLVYASRAVRDLLMVLRSVDDPTDTLHVVAALRTPLFGCGDDDLFRFKVERKGSWSYLSPQPDTVPAGDPVLAALAYLRTLHEERRWLSPAEVLDRIARERRCFELAFAEGRPRDVWRRLRYVIDQARAWSEATSGGLRSYLEWVELQTAEGARVAEAVLPETDDDAVRIMTIHGAKGLEFPITILTGMSTVPQSRYASAEVAFPPNGDVGYRFGKHLVTREFAEWVPIDEQMGYDERIRLLYVACTRAKDHLVVSLQRRSRSKAPVREARTSAELLVDGMGPSIDDLPQVDDEALTIRAVVPPLAPAPPAPFREWEADVGAALQAASRPSTVAATALTDTGAPDVVDESLPLDRLGGDGAVGDGEEDPASGLQKRPRDLDLPPWLKGRYGTAVGRAVHGVLQTIDLATGAGVDHAVAAQCEAEAIPERRSDVRRLVRSALDSAIVRTAAARPHWREIYACTPMPDGRLLEGYIDLLYRDDDGLVVVDYKTAGTSRPEDLAERATGYRLQGASYALAVGRTTGEPVARVAFLFLTPGGAVEVDLEDLATAVGEVERLVAGGREVVLD